MASQAALRVATLDWGLTEMLLSLGRVPVAMSNPRGFRSNFAESVLPENVIDLGLSFQPNMELLLSLRLGLILITPEHAHLCASLERIAPTMTLGRYKSSGTPYTAARLETLQLAGVLDCADRAGEVLRKADKEIAAARARLEGLPAVRGRPVYIVRFVDDTYMRVFGRRSMFGEVLEMLGLDNAWSMPACAAAGFSIVEMERIGERAETSLLYLKPLPAPAASMMRTSPLWRAMPFARSGRIGALPDISADGGVISAAHFASGLAQALCKKEFA